MKILLLIPVLFCLSTSMLWSQKNPTKIFMTKPIDDSTSMSEVEVSVEDWINFLLNIDFDARLFPDTNCLSSVERQLFEDLKNNKKSSEYIDITDYGRIINPNFGQFRFKVTKAFNELVKSDTNYFSIRIPIVGISYAQAQAFCLWKEFIVNSTQAVKVNISLPTVEIYERVIENRDSMNAKKCYMVNSLNCHCQSAITKGNYKYQGKSLLDNDAYFPSKLKIYNLQGNAAEMTRTEGTAMGGSYRHTARESYRDQRQYYTKPEKWLGFRFIVTIKK